MMKIKFIKIFEEKYNFYEFFFCMIYVAFVFQLAPHFMISPFSRHKKMHNMKQNRNTQLRHDRCSTFSCTNELFINAIILQLFGSQRTLQGFTSTKTTSFSYQPTNYSDTYSRSLTISSTTLTREEANFQSISFIKQK